MKKQASNLPLNVSAYTAIIHTRRIKKISHVEVRITEQTDKQARFIQLRASGWSYTDIAAELGISKGSCSNWARRYREEIHRAASKITAGGAKPLPRADKKKAPRVVDITDKLSADGESDGRAAAHCFTPEFRDHYDIGDVTEQDREEIATLKKAARQIGETFRDAAAEEVQKAAAGISETITAILRQQYAEMQQGLTFADDLSDTASSILASYKPLWEKLERQIRDYLDAIPEEEKEQLRAEIEQGQEAAAIPPGSITVLNTDAGSGKKSKAKEKSETTVIAIQNLFQKAFATMLSGAITSHLTTINTTVKKPDIDAVTGEAAIRLNNGFTLHIENYDRTHREWKTSTIKLLHLCTLLLTENNHYREKHKDAIKATVAFNISEYMALLNTPDTQSSRKEARSKIKKDLDTLRHSSIDWKERSRGKEKAFLNTPILGGSYGIDKKGNVIVTFSPQFAEYLIQDAYLMQYSLKLLTVDERNANVYPLGYKLLMQSSIDHNIQVGTADIISVKKALEVCPSIPTIKELQAKKDSHWERKIKDALEKTLDSIPYMRWEYCNSKGVPLTDKQLAVSSYATFIGLYIHYEVIGAPDQTKRLQAKAEKARKRKARNDAKKATKKKGASRPNS